MKEKIIRTEKKCSKCKKVKGIDAFRLHKHHADGHYSICKECISNQEKAEWIAIRDEVYKAYGGYKCACCGESNKLFLNIDHISNNGKQHRLSNPQARKLVIYLKRKKFPDGYQPLCFNCNLGKARNGGVCPHKSKEA